MRKARSIYQNAPILPCTPSCATGSASAGASFLPVLSRTFSNKNGTGKASGTRKHGASQGIGVVAALALGLAIAFSTTTAWAVDGDTLRRQQSAQQQAQQIARELVVTTLDLQIRQLEDNRLTQDNPLYVEIRRMRSSVDGLLQKEMSSVVALLV